MKIGIDARILGESGGIGEYIENLVLEMAQTHKEDEFILFLNSRQFEKKDFNLPNIKKKLADVPVYSLAEQCKLKRIFENEKLDILHVPHWNAPVFYKGKMIVTIHDLVPLNFTSTKRLKFFQWLRKKYFLLALKILGRKVSKIIAVSNLTRNDLINKIKIDPKKIEVIYSGVVKSGAYEEAANISQADAREKVKKEFNISSPYFFASSIWRAHKNLNGLINAFKKFSSDFSSVGVKLVIGGRADESFTNIVKLFKKYKSNPQIIFLGMLDAQEQAILMRGALANVLPSFVEGFGFFYVEALTAGGRLISSANVGAKEVTEGAVEFFDPKNIEEFSQKMVKAASFFKNQPLKILWKINPSWEDVADKTYRVYLTRMRG